MTLAGKLVAAAASFGCFGLMNTAAFAHKEAPLQPTTIESANHKFVVHMEPKPKGAYGLWGWGPGVGTVCEIKEKGEQSLWSVPFYARSVLLGNDGETLVAIGPGHVAEESKFGTDRSDFLTEPAIEFYRKGRLNKSYKIKDLIPVPTPAMTQSILGGGWMPWRAGDALLSSDEKQVSLRLLDGTTCIFETATGKLLERRRHP